MKTIIVLISLMSFGCSHTGVAYMRKGKPVYEATCNGTANSIAGCHKEANRVCKGGEYEVVDGESSSGFVSGGGRVMPTKHRSLLFYCI